MGDVINLADIVKMQEALDNADVSDEEPRMLVYRDNMGIPQVIEEGMTITQQQYEAMPDEIKAMLLITTEE